MRREDLCRTDIKHKYSSRPNCPFSIRAKFRVIRTTRLVLSNETEQTVNNFPEGSVRVGSTVTLIYGDNSSYEIMRKALRKLGLQIREGQEKVMADVNAFVVEQSMKQFPDDLHNCLWLGVSVEWVTEYHDRLDRVRTGPKPASELAVQELKRMGVDDLMVDDDDQCVVCYDELVDKQKVVVLPCDHVFHEAVLLSGWRLVMFCPLCRFTIK